MPYWVYIIESESDGKWYYGSSGDLVQRFMDHNTNRSKYTRFKGPWKLIFSRSFEEKNTALEFERYLKRTRNKQFIKKTFAEFFQNG